MESSCYHCGKSVLYGRTHTHHRGVAGGRWKKRAPKKQKIFRVNFVRLSIIEKGEEKRVKICTKCLKRIKYDLRKGNKPFLMLAKTARAEIKKEAVETEAKAEVKAEAKPEKVKKTVKKTPKKSAKK